MGGCGGTGGCGGGGKGGWIITGGGMGCGAGTGTGASVCTVSVTEVVLTDPLDVSSTGAPWPTKAAMDKMVAIQKTFIDVFCF